MKRQKLYASLVAALLLGACATTEEAKKEEAPAQPAAAPQPAAEQPQPSPEAWRAQPPKPGESPELVIPTFQKETLPNGLTLIVSERHDVPLVSMAVAFSAGTAQDPKGKAGIADLTYRTLLEGAGKMDALQLEQAFGDLGTQPYAAAQQDGAFVGARALTTNAEKVLELLSTVVTKPQMKKDSFELKKSEQLRQLAQAVGTPGYLARWAFADVLYGEGHPYGQVSGGTPQTVGGLTINDAKAYWKKWAGPKGAALVITGDVTMEQAKAWAQKYFGNWKGQGTRPPKPPELAPEQERQVVVIPKPGLPQTVILMGRPAIEAGHPDEAALQLASTVLGGFFGSRLNMNLREDKGYSYGAGAYVDPRRGEGPVVASSQVRADVTGASVTEFINELEGLKTRPITEAELSAAREGLVQSLPGTFATVDDLTRAAAGIFWEDKELDHYQKLIPRLQGATPQQVQAAAERYFQPSLMDIVLVGDPDQVMMQVQPLNVGKLELRQPPGTGAAAKTAPAAAAGSSAK